MSIPDRRKTYDNLRSAAKMAAETAEKAIGRVMEVEAVIDAAIAFVDSLEREDEASDSEKACLMSRFVGRLRAYQESRPS